MPQSNTLDYFRRGESLPYLNGKVNTEGLDYFCRNEQYEGASHTPQAYSVTFAGGSVASGVSTPETTYAPEVTGTSTAQGQFPLSWSLPTTGGVESSGAWDALLIYGHPISGGGILSGSHTMDVTYEPSFSGSVDLTASATIEEILGWEAIGGVTLDSLFFFGFSVISDGDLSTLAGDAVPALSYAPVMTGGAALAGAAAPDLSVVATGSFLAVGSVDSAHAIAVTFAGGAVLAGSWSPVVGITFTGGAVLAGSGGVSITPAISGGIALSHAASLTLVYAPTMTGTVSGSGIAGNTSVYVVSLSGSTLTLTGTNLAGLFFSLDVGDGLLLPGGSATEVMTWNPSPISGLTLTALAGVPTLYAQATAGGVAFASGQTSSIIFVVDMSGSVALAETATVARIATLSMSGTFTLPEGCVIMADYTPDVSGLQPVLGSGAVTLVSVTAFTAQGGAALAADASAQTAYTAAGTAGAAAASAASTAIEYVVASTIPLLGSATHTPTQVFAPQGTGAIILLATNGGAAVYEVAGSGTAIASGLHTIQQVFAYTPASGLTLSGTTPYSTDFGFPISGGAALAATFTAATAWQATSSGSMQVLSLSATAWTIEPAVAGSLALSATGVSSLIWVYEPTGGMAIAGTAVVSTDFGYPISGGAVSGGSSVLAITHAASMLAGASLVATAEVPLTYTPTLSGGVAASGEAGIHQTIVYHLAGSGGVTLSVTDSSVLSQQRYTLVYAPPITGGILLASACDTQNIYTPGMLGGVAGGGSSGGGAAQNVTAAAGVSLQSGSSFPVTYAAVPQGGGQGAGLSLLSISLAALGGAAVETVAPVEIDYDAFGVGGAILAGAIDEGGTIWPVEATGGVRVRGAAVNNFKRLHNH